MDRDKEIAKAVGRYLEEVAAQLGEMPADERDDVLRDIESHIYAALEKSGPEPTLDDLNVILAGMDPPSAYATSIRTPQGAETSPKVCRVAVVAAAWGPFGVLLLLGWFVSFRVTPGEPLQPLPWSVTCLRLILPVALTAPFGCTVLGLLAISRIRASKGRLIGMPLAVATALLYPLIAFIAALAIGTGHAARLIWGAGLSAPEVHNLVTAGASFGVVVGVFVSILIFRAVWRWANTSAPRGTKKICKYIFAAALFAIIALAFPVAYIAWEVEAVNRVSTYWSFVWFVALPLSLIGMFVCTLLGFAAVSKIRASRGTLMGLLPAVFAVLVWPIIGLNIGVVVTASVVLDNTLGRLGGSGIASVAVIFMTLASALGLIAALTVWIPRSFWKWANRPLSDGEIA